MREKNEINLAKMQILRTGIYPEAPEADLLQVCRVRAAAA